MNKRNTTQTNNATCIKPTHVPHKHNNNTMRQTIATPTPTSPRWLSFSVFSLFPGFHPRGRVRSGISTWRGCSDELCRCLPRTLRASSAVQSSNPARRRRARRAASPTARSRAPKQRAAQRRRGESCGVDDTSRSRLKLLLKRDREVSETNTRPPRLTPTRLPHPQA